MEEIWRDVVGYEGYYKVSNIGNIKGVCRRVYSYNGGLTIPERQMIPYKHKCGYLKIALTKEHNPITYLVHRLVAIAFIDNPENKRTVNHKDGNRTNNGVANLEWMTHKENIIHSFTNLNRVAYHKGKYGKEYNPQCVRVIKTTLDGEYIEEYESVRLAAEANGVKPPNIFSVLSGKYKTSAGFKWIRA